jgi:hypothetical protein
LRFDQEELFAFDVIDLRPIEGDDAKNVVQSDIQDIAIEENPARVILFSRGTLPWDGSGE